MSEIDTFGVQEVFVEALARVERIGPNRRLVFVISAPNGDGTRDQQAVLKVTMSAEASLQAALAMLNEAGEMPAALENASTGWAN
ncbi:hypothetical protein [Bradyrhizobium sp. BWC-3-1]|uniref:hypothetical protein n=1 Tax=Bradyrhizobium sp. BWC-3-1 TaxID=3080012 RepID=UPI00293E9149|nr:hypothetical protein [Bradyrhizobium sp. BWC-3-1]WOH55056.1 hypothetical protein RX329_22280 [Bradyrhizobium sp. BWC-3-1]